MIGNDLPRGWEIAELGDVARWASGGTPKGRNPRYYGGTIPWAVIGDLNDGLVHDTADHLTPDGLAESSAKLVPSGAVLVAMYGSIGKLGIAGREMTTNQAIAFAVPDERRIAQRYLLHYLRYQRPALTSAGKGATQQNISQTLLRSWPIPLPPLAEQHEIVDLVDDHLSRLGYAITSLQNVRAQSARLDRSIVEASFHSLHGEYPSHPLGAIATLENGDRGTNYPSKSTLVTRGVPFVNAGHLVGGRIDVDGVSYISQEHFERLKAGKFGQGDLLFCLRGSLGKCALVDTDLHGAIASSLVIVRAGERVLPEYLFWYLQSDAARAEVGRYNNGTAQPNLAARDLARFAVPLPPLEAQRAMAESFESTSRRSLKLRQALGSADRLGEGLRRSILHQAFRGRLTKTWRERHHD